MTIEEIVSEYLHLKVGTEITEYMIETECPIYARANYGIHHLGSSYSRLFRKVRDLIDLDIEVVPNKKHKTWLIQEQAKDLTLFNNK